MRRNEVDDEKSPKKKKKKKHKSSKGLESSPVKKAKKSKKSSKRPQPTSDLEHEPMDQDDQDYADANELCNMDNPLPSKLMQMAGYNEREEDVQGSPISQHHHRERDGSNSSSNRKRKREEPRSPPPHEKQKMKSASAKSSRQPPRTPPEPLRRGASMSPPTDPRLRGRPSTGPRTPSPPLSRSTKTGPRTPSPRYQHPRGTSPPPSGGRRPHSKSPSPRYRGQMSPGGGRRGSGRSPSPLSPRRPRRGHSPSPMSPKRGMSPKRPRQMSPTSRSSRRPRSPSYRRHSPHGGHSPPPTSYSRSSRYADQQPFRLERSVADSTINDADLIRPYAGGHHGADGYYDHHGAGGGNLIADTTRQNSPKRPSLDERLEKELGIKMGDDIPDLSKPPPGYPPRIASTSSTSAASPTINIMPGAKLGHIPSYTKESSGKSADQDSNRGHLRVGNMLQIVPSNSDSIEKSTSSRPSPKTSSTASPMTMVPVVALAGERQLASVQEESKAHNELLKRLEEKKKQRELEKKQKREQRLLEAAKRHENEISRENSELQQNNSENSTTKSSTTKSSGRILETIEREEDHEARILAEAMTSVPEEDAFEDMLNDDEMEDIQGMSAEKRSNKSKKKDEVRYISLKPFSKKERKRQARNLVANDSIDDFDDEDEDFVKRSPVPLPDASTCKSILHGPEYTITKSKDTIKKVLKYADGVLPGQGSPDHHNDVLDPSPPSLTSNK